MCLKDRKFVVYKHTNKINGKVYIGITCQDPPEKRWGNTGWGYKTQLVFDRAISKYGWDNFSHDILYKGLSNQDALDIEKELIAYYKSINKSYNMSEGYDNTPDTSIKIDIYNLDKTFIGTFNSLEEASKILNISSSGLNGAFHNYKGMVHYKNYKVVKHGEIPDFTKYEKRKRKTIKVGQYDNNLNLVKEYNSLLEAQKETGIRAGVIYNVLKGLHKKAGGYYWKKL